jgi:glutamate/tyrosine decarboxylase-like PLP-dependent enzyme
MFNKSGTNRGKYRIEGSMGGQPAASLYGTIKVLGANGIRLLLEHNIEMAEIFNESIKSSNILVPLFDPELNTVSVRPLTDDPERYPPKSVFDEAERILKDEKGIYLSTTEIPVKINDEEKPKKRKVFRYVPTHPFTDSSDVEGHAKLLVETWRSLSK